MTGRPRPIPTCTLAPWRADKKMGLPFSSFAEPRYSAPPPTDLTKLLTALWLIHREYCRNDPDAAAAAPLLDGLYDLVIDAAHELMDDAAPGMGTYQPPPATAEKIEALRRLRDSGGDPTGTVAKYLKDFFDG